MTRRRPAARTRAAASRSRGTGLPRALARLFWDYPPGAVHLDRDRELVVRRVAGEGGLREMRLLRAAVGDSTIREVLLGTSARGLSPRRIRFWQLLLDLPARRANGWVRAARATSWAGRTAG